ncbi:acetolactate synthase small subunit [Ethanoligenens sp.]|uniref:acetolactate synthase small subunit n=1 Tax=Ethanoligenens sp. TaxID=2099655 RepID=UPI0039E80DF7
MKHTLSVLVENRPGVLSKVAGLFSRRAFNIDSLAVGVTQDPLVSRITIVVNGDDYTTEQVEKQLNKLIDVIKVKTLPHGQFINRELVLLKVACGASNRAEVVQIADIFGAKIVDVTRTTLTLEVSGKPSRIASLESLLLPYGIRETVRTGTIALERGAQDITAGKKPAEEPPDSSS